MAQKKSDAILVNLFLVAVLACAGWLWIKHFTFVQPTRSDFREVEGVLASTNERGGRKKYRDILLEGDKITYRVPIDGYQDRFDGKKFVEEVAPGERIKLVVGAGKPESPPFAEESIHFVRGIRVGETDYSRVEEFIEWTRDNNRWALYGAISMTVCFAAISWVWFTGNRKMAEQAVDDQSPTRRELDA